MFGFSKRKQKKIDQQVESFNQVLQDRTLSSSMQKNLEAINKLFADNDTLVTRTIKNKKTDKLQFSIVYSDGMVNAAIMNDNLIKPLMFYEANQLEGNLLDHLMEQVIYINESKKTSRLKDIIESVSYGDSILLVEGSKEALIINTRNIQTRPVMEPENERVLSGPREGFSEGLLLNLSLVRRRVRTNELKMKYYTLGKQTQTQICICYIDSIVDKGILNELYQRLSKINIDGVLDSNYITELIRDSGWSPFRTIGYTERPDTVVGKILEGRIAVFVDGSPMVLTIPYLFMENFQSSEDYYLSYYYTSFSRSLRILGFFLTICVPGIFLATVAFHQEMLPTPLLINIATERKNVPLPAAVEAFLLLIVFDILRETGVRMPSGIGQALSIVGALVIGQAAVQAKLVAAPMIIVVGLTGITNLLVPKMNAPVIYYRFLILALSSTFGFFGFIIGVSFMLIHILNLRSFGVLVLAASNDFKFQRIKDLVFRAPWTKMRTRPAWLTANQTRLSLSKQQPNGD